ncbi:MAG TPA: long-chain fatty acid--CoA ligase [Chthoniobacterales bacterium]
MAENSSDLAPTRVFDFIRHQRAHYPRDDALAYKVEGRWRKFSTAEVIAQSDALAWALYRQGVRPGDRVANVTETNRPEWNLIDIAVMSLGAVHVPIYPTIPPEEFRYVLEHSGAKKVFVSSARLQQMLLPLVSRPSDPYPVYTYDEVPCSRSLRQLCAEAADGLGPSARETLRSLRDQVKPDDLAALIYTSGTTGTPKGVMLSHRNLVSNALASAQILMSTNTERALSFLPLCHIYERTIVNIYLYSGTSVYYAENLQTVSENLREVQPELFSTVPRLLEKIYEKILEKGEKLTGVQQKIFQWALCRAMEHDPERPPSRFHDCVQAAIADRLVYRRWREALGGRVRAITCGSAALQPRLARILWAAGIPVYEGYGPTEASPVISVNRPRGNQHRIGTVGPVLPGGEVKIAPDGEILYRGPNVMLGYYQRPELTAEAVDAEGWLHTGDVGEYDGAFLKITDRKKEIFKTSGGKYIAPQQVENKLKESRYVMQVMVIGENHKFPAALIVPNFKAVAECLQVDADTGEARASLVLRPDIHDLFDRELVRLNADLGHFAQVKKYVLLPEEWTMANGELTPTLKLRRKWIAARHAEAIARVYAGEEHLSEVLDWCESTSVKGKWRLPGSEPLPAS